MWNISSKYPLEKYTKWFQHSVKINAPYYVYGNEVLMDVISQSRGALETIRDSSVPHISSMFSASLVQKIAAKLQSKAPQWDLGFVWTEKAALVQKAAATQTQYDWFAWVDAGVNLFRENDPPSAKWPSQMGLSRLPHDKVIVTFMGNNLHCTGNAPAWSEEVCIGGTSWMLHRNMVDKFSKIFYNALEQCLTETSLAERCLDDQTILSTLLSDRPELFYSIGEGWAGLIPDLYKADGVGCDTDGHEFATYRCSPKPFCAMLENMNFAQCFSSHKKRASNHMRASVLYIGTGLI
jgi:hypothetical protein